VCVHIYIYIYICTYDFSFCFIFVLFFVFVFSIYQLLTCVGVLLHPAKLRFRKNKTGCVLEYGRKAQELETQQKKT